MPRMLRLPFVALTLAALISGCSTAPRELSDLPRTPQASVDQILQDANRRSGAEANLLRLHAARAAWVGGQPERVQSILRDIPQSDLPTDQQIVFSQLQAQSALALDQVPQALRAIRHPSIGQLDILPVEDQLDIQQLRADIFDAAGQHLDAAKERIFIDGLLPSERQTSNRLAIWDSLGQLSTPQLQQARDQSAGGLEGWLSLALIERQHGNLDLQVRALRQWQEANADHPAANPLPDSLMQLFQLHASRPQHIALLLPFQGPLASAAQALRDGFLAAQYQAHSQGLEQPQVSLYDSTAYSNLQQFYAQAQQDGVQWVIGPLERDQVGRLANLGELPLPTLALNYSEQRRVSEQPLYQFGLAPEDEARSAAHRAWADGHRSMAALTAQTDWGQRAFQAFRETWESLGGVLVGREVIDQPASMAQQIGDLLQIRQSEQRGNRIQQLLGQGIVVQPTPRQDIDALFLAANPLQARQIKPTLAFQYAGDLPVYATSHAYQVGDNLQNADLDGLYIAEIPWLLERSDSLYQAVSQSWPQAGGAMGRLYAMGIDAQRIFSRLRQLQQFPGTRIEGATGTLSLGDNGRIQRELHWGLISNGQLQPAPELIPAP